MSLGLPHASSLLSSLPGGLTDTRSAVFSSGWSVSYFSSCWLCVSGLVAGCVSGLLAGGVSGLPAGCVSGLLAGRVSGLLAERVSGLLAGGCTFWFALPVVTFLVCSPGGVVSDLLPFCSLFLLAGCCRVAVYSIVLALFPSFVFQGLYILSSMKP